MIRKKILAIVLSTIVLSLLAGCSSFKISPEIEDADIKDGEIHSFSYNIRSFVTDGPYEIQTINIAEEVMSEARRVSENSRKKGPNHVSIHLTQRSHGGAGGFEYLTGLSLGLIPSWSTRPAMYRFRYRLYKSGVLCSEKWYVIDETGYGHILLMPFGIYELVVGVYKDVLDLYKKSLTSFVQSGC